MSGILTDIPDVNEPDVMDKINKAFDRVSIIRMLITIFLVAWLAYMTYSIMVKYNSTESEQTKSEEETVDEQPKAKKCLADRQDPRFYQRDEGFVNNPESIELPNNPNDDDRNVLRLFYLHKIWFGDDSIVYMIFKIWFFTILLINFAPVLVEIARYIGTKTDFELLKNI